MKKLTFTLLSALLLLFVSCGTKEKEAPVIAKVIETGSTPLIVLDFYKLNDTLTIPLSDFVSNIEMVMLDNSNEALISPGETIVTDNYIVVKGRGDDGRLSVKCYDKKTGKYLNRIGFNGRGPFEYNLIYDIQVDEKGNSIYILPWQSTKILHFTLNGQPVKEIPLPYFSAKGVFKVNPDNTITVAVLPFANNPSFVWLQDMDGNILHEISAAPYSVGNDYSNEVYSNGNVAGTNDIYLFNFMNKRDSLYHYDYVKKELNPVFTVDYGALSELPVHAYAELPNHFIGDVTIMKQVGPNSWSGDQRFNYIVDKSTLKGNYCRIENDLLGSVVEPYYFGNGYYSEMYEPEILIDILTKRLEDKKIDNNLRGRIQNLLNSLTPEGNSVIIIGKLK